MKSFYINPPKLVQTIFHDLIWINNKNEIIITFDDGPFPECTELIVDFLSLNKLKSIFFVNGNLKAAEKKSIEKIVQAGSYLANHSFSHSRDFRKFNRSKIIEELINTEKEISGSKNFIRVFRPPYGFFNLKIIKVCKDLNYKIMMWSLLTEDYSGSLKKVRTNISKYLRSNSIVVFHNNPKSKEIIIPSLEFLLEESHKRGYRIGTTFNF